MTREAQRQWTCDRCGKTKTISDASVVIPKGWSEVELDRHNGDRVTWEGHLCKRCVSKFSKWFGWK